MSQSGAAQQTRRLAGRRALITGAASGIGRSIAEVFAREGAKLALIDNNADGVDAAARELGAAALPFDLEKSELIESIVDQAAHAIGGLDIVVNCAAFSKGKSLVETDLALFSKFTAINLVAPFLICRAALPHMRSAGGGAIVNIASALGLLPNTPNNSAYAATKGGLIALSKSLAAELAPQIRVNVVCPGITNTPMSAHLFAAYDDPSQAAFVQQYAMKRIAEPEEIANAVLFLASNEASYITGSALAVDGGRCFH